MSHVSSNSQPDPGGAPRSSVFASLTRRTGLDWILGRLRSPLRPSFRPDPDEVARERLRVQVRVVRDALGPRVAAAGDGPRRPRDDADTRFLFRPDHLLVREDRLEEVIDFFRRRPEQFDNAVPERPTRRPPVDGVVLLPVPPRTDGEDAVLMTLEQLDRELGSDDDPRRAPSFSPDHLLYVTKISAGLCPATEPEVPDRPRPWPAPATGNAGHGVRVSVVDTGLWQPATTSGTTPWLKGVVADPEDVEQVDSHAIHPYAGHGTFVSGVIRCLAPATEIDVEGALTHGGAVFESELVAQLDDALSEDHHPQLISMSAGTHTRKSFALLTFELLAARHGLDDGEKTLVVAAAGNDGSTEPFWPAAFGWVVGVGSVGNTGTVSTFSNTGKWVDVFARGEGVVNAFPAGTYTCYEPPHAGQVRTFTGLARWSGTSFATPIVTALIAARMSETGESAPKAWASVQAAGTVSHQPRAGTSPTVGPLT